MTIILYCKLVSPPSRAVLMTIEHLGIELEKKIVNTSAGEHKTPEFLEMNPQHCVPTLDDDGFYLWESRAIQTYLVSKYAPNNPLYPSDPKQRAVVDKMLFWDIGTLWKTLFDYMRPLLFTGGPSDPEKEETFKKTLAVLENILEKTTYVAGQHLTVADFSILSNIGFAEEVIDYSFDDYPKISAWLQRMKKETPKHNEINEIPLKEVKEVLKNKFGLSSLKN